MPNLTHSDYVCKREIIVNLLGRDLCTDFSLQSCRCVFFQSDSSKYSTPQYSTVTPLSIRYNALIKVDHPVCPCSNTLHSHPDILLLLLHHGRVGQDSACGNKSISANFFEKGPFFSLICKTRAGHPRQPASGLPLQPASQPPRRPLVYLLLMLTMTGCYFCNNGNH